MGVTIDQPDARRLAYSVVLGQAAVTIAVALASWAISGVPAARSALVGGGISVIASLAMALIAFRRVDRVDAFRALRAFFTGEAVKLALVVVMFVLVFREMKVSPLALFAGFGATFCVHWIALANLLPPLRWGRRQAGAGQ
jgi:ATP synthase protein I